MKEVSVSRGKIRGLDDKIIDAVVGIISALVLLITLYPLIYCVSASFSDPIRVMAGELKLLPLGFTLEGYQIILDYDPIWIGYRNSLFYTIVGTSINMMLTIPCAYALSRKDLDGRNILTLIFSFTMFFSGGMIPSYLLMRNLGMINTVWAVLMPGAVSMWNCIIARTYFQGSISFEMQESAMLDGCSNVKLLLHIILPLSKPMMAVIALYYAVGHWNSYFNALIYLNNLDLYPLQLFLRNILITDQMMDMLGADSDAAQAIMRRIQLKESMKFGIIIISSLPMLLLYPFLQKYFVKGVMIGAIKG